MVESPFASFEELEREALACTKCPLATQGRSQVVFGDGDPAADLVFVGEGPGAEEDKQGIPFVGRAGRLLTGLIADIGLRRDEVYIANVVKCRPPGNRRPRADEIAACRPYLLAEIEAVRPQVVVTLGATALRGLLGHSVRFKGARGGPIESGGVLLWPTYHPAATLYNRRLEAEIRSDFRSMRRLLLSMRSRNPAKGHRSEKRSSPVNARRRGPSRGAKRSARRSR